MGFKSKFANENILEEEENDSDLELQLAFEKGLLKPGLNHEFVKKETPINNIDALKNKIIEFKIELPWDEKFNLVCEPAPMAPELAIQLETHNENSKDVDLSENDFAREMLFYRIAQAGVLEGITRLKKLGIPTKRPDDYFAEMAKTDEHMQKVRKTLLNKENIIHLKENAKRQRELKKFGKKVQVEKQLERQKEKRTMLEQIKKFRKGKSDSLDFLDSKVPASDSNGIMKSKKQLKRDMQTIKDRRKGKDKKFGFGSEKRKPGWKKNTRKDLDGPLRDVGKSKGRNSMTNKNKKRPGKNSRQNAKKKGR